MQSLVEAGLELIGTEAQSLCMTGDVGRSQCPLIGEQPIVHLPEFTLLARTTGCLVGFERLLMDRLQRKVAENILQFAGRNVIAFKLRDRFFDMARAES